MALQGKLQRNGHHPPFYSGASERAQPDARTKDGEPKAQKSQTRCSLPSSVTRAQLLTKPSASTPVPGNLSRASCVDRPAGAGHGAHPGPRVMPDLAGGEKTRQSRGGWPSWLLTPRDQHGHTGQPARILKTGQQALPGHQERPSPLRRVAPKYTCLCGFPLVLVSRAYVCL